MPNEIRHKTSTTAGAVPTAAQLTAGELAINAASGKVYTKKTDGTVVDLTDLQVMDGGEQFTPLNISNLALWLDGSDTTTLYQTQAGGAAAVTAPTDIAGCFAWWDASDASTLTVAPVTNRISQWNDKVGGRNFTASTTATQPLRETGTLNGRNVVRFEVATNMTVANDKTSWNFLHQPTGGGWLFMVLQPFNAFSAEQFGRVIATSNFSSALVGFDFFIDDRHSNGQQSGCARIGIQRGVSGTSSASTNALNVFPNDTGAYVVAIKYDPGNATAAERVRLFVNGVGGANITTATDAASTANASGDLTLGIGAATTGYVAEILIYNTLLTDVNRARIEKYLALKWGITSVTNTIAQDTAPITTPLGITNNTCALWLDGADANTMYNATTGGSLVTTNSAVLRWEDKSGNGRHATQSNSSVAPLRFLGGLNSRDVLSFNATRGMTAGAIGDWNFLHNAEGGSVFMVLKPALTADPQDFVYLLQTQNNTSTQVGFGLFYDDRAAGFNRNNYLSSLVFFGTSGQSVSFVEQNNFFTTANTYALVSVVVDSGVSAPVANRVAMYREGTRLGSNNTQTNPPSTSNSATALQIGVASGANSPGEIAEIIIFRRPLSDVDRARVENYLAAKWGLSVPNSQPPVGSWQDRSGNSRHFTQSLASARPIRGTQNNLAAVSFNGSTAVLSRDVTNSQIADSTGAAAFVVFQPNNDTEYTALDIAPFAAHRDRFTNGQSFPGAFRSTRIANIMQNIMPVSAPGLLTHSVIAGVGPQQVRLDGAVRHTATNDFASWLTRTNTYRIGAGGQGDWLTGTVAEILIYGRSMTTAEITRVERYLATKWGIRLAPQVANLDAQDWINRVYTVGGTVTQGTAAAVNNFCNAIDNAGIRDRFYRLNLFCGDDLTTCLVPLYRGPSLTGTQFGNATDTNVSFVAADYLETGSFGGLRSNGSTKYLTTGCSVSGLGLSNSLHFLINPFGPITFNNRNFFGTKSTGACRLSAYALSESQWNMQYSGTSATSLNDNPASLFRRLLISRTSNVAAALYANGLSVASDSAAANITPDTDEIWVFRQSASGTSAGQGLGVGMRCYSFGDGMTNSQVAAYDAALTQFMSALGRVTV